MLRHTTLDATRQANFERSEQLNEEVGASTAHLICPHFRSL